MLNPEAGPIQLPTLGRNSRQRSGPITAIRMLGGGEVPFTQDNDKLILSIPAERPNRYTTVFEVRGAVTE